MIRMGTNQIMYFGIITLWIVGVILYLLYLRKELGRRLKEEKEEDAKRKRHRGKKCPQCGNIISVTREVCQHCGHQFSEVPAVAAEDQAQRSSSYSSRKKKRRGKKCPQCKNVINYYREVCQHCGYKFGPVETPGESEDKGAAN